MELFDEVLHEQQVVVDASFLNESILDFEDNVAKNRCLSISHELGENLCKAMDQTNWAIVLYVGGVRHFANKDDVGGVNKDHTVSPKIYKEVDGRHNVILIP